MNLLPFQYVNQLQLLLESNNKLILLMFQLFVLCTQAGDTGYVLWDSCTILWSQDDSCIMVSAQLVVCCICTLAQVSSKVTISLSCPKTMHCYHCRAESGHARQHPPANTLLYSDLFTSL